MQNTQTALSGKEQAHSLTVPAGMRNERLDRFLGEALSHTDLSREKIKRAIRDGQCTVDGTVCTTPSTRLRSGQRVELAIAPAATAVEPEEGDLTIIHRDEHLLVIDKPAGLTVHPCPSCPEGTLVHRLVHHFDALRAQEGFRPGIVHRIDKDTSGLLLVALSEGVRLKLSEAFAERTVEKEYLALVHGVPPATGEVDAPIGRHPTHKVRMAVVKGGKPARSEWRVLHAAPEGHYALVAVRIHSGRTHQIRVHMAHAGFPLWGDQLYGPGTPARLREQGYGARQMLHAWHLAFTHPVTGERLRFTCPPPQDFPDLAVALARRMTRVVITGSPGCGKSALLHCLQDRGVPTWSADAAVAALYEPGADGWHCLRGRFGERFVPDDSAPVDRRALLAAMQTEPGLRREVEQMVHPLVRHDMEAFYKHHAESGAPVAVAEVPLFLEAGWRSGDGSCDVLAGVACPERERMHRLTEIRGWTPETIAAMTAWQWPDEDKMRACDMLIDNGGSLEDLSGETGRFIAALEARREAAASRLTEELHDIWKD